MNPKWTSESINPCFTPVEKTLLIAVAALRRQKPTRLHIANAITDQELAAIQISSTEVGLIWHRGRITIRELAEQVEEKRRWAKRWR